MVCPSSYNETRKLAMLVGTPSLVQLNLKAFLLGESKALLMSHEERKRGEVEEADCSNIACTCLLYPPIMGDLTLLHSAMMEIQERPEKW